MSFWMTASDTSRSTSRSSLEINKNRCYKSMSIYVSLVADRLGGARIVWAGNLFYKTGALFILLLIVRAVDFDYYFIQQPGRIRLSLAHAHCILPPKAPLNCQDTSHNERKTSNKNENIIPCSFFTSNYKKSSKYSEFFLKF